LCYVERSIIRCLDGGLLTNNFDAMADPGFDLQAYEPPISLWQLVEQHIPAHEHEEIRSLLGNSMIDQSLELHQEVLL